MTKEKALSLLESGGTKYLSLPQGLQVDRDVVLKSLEYSCDSCENIGEFFSDDAEVILKANSLWGRQISILQKLSPRLKADMGFAEKLKVALPNGSFLSFLDSSIQDSKEFVLSYLSFAKREGLIFVSERLRDDEEVVEKAVHMSEAWQLRYASERLRGDKAFLSQFFERGTYAYKYATRALKLDRDFAKKAFSFNGACLEYSPFKNSPELVNIALANNPQALVFASKRFRRNRDLVKNALNSSPFLLNCSTEWRKDPEFVLLALEKNTSVAIVVDESLFNDRTFMFDAYKRGLVSIVEGWMGDDLRNDLAFLLRIKMGLGHYDMPVVNYKKKAH